MGGTVSELVKIIENGIAHITQEIEPSLFKVRNIMVAVIDNIESKAQTNGHYIMESLRTNLLVWLCAAVVFCLLALTFIRSLTNLLHALQFGLITRLYVSLFVVTLIILWFLIISIYGVFVSENIGWKLFKEIVLGVFCLCTVILVIIWLRFMCVYRRRIRQAFIRFLCDCAPIKETNGLQESAMTLPMLTIKNKYRKEKSKNEVHCV